ncbi:hypothetical protein AB5I41_06635 [Sphingomonas sp. MMS24-JH45]
MTDLTDFGIAGLRDGFRAGDFTARAVAEAFNAAVAAARPLNAFPGRDPRPRARRRRCRGRRAGRGRGARCSPACRSA